MFSWWRHFRVSWHIFTISKWLHSVHIVKLWRRKFDCAALIWAAVSKRTIWHLCPIETNQLAHPQSLIIVFVVRMKKPCILGYPKFAKILIGLLECAGWYESSLGVRIQKYVFWRCGTFNVILVLVYSNFNGSSILGAVAIRSRHG